MSPIPLTAYPIAPCVMVYAPSPLHPIKVLTILAKKIKIVKKDEGV